MRLRKINAKTSLFFSVILGSRLQVCVSKLRKSVRDLKSTWQHFENYDYASRKAIGNCALFSSMESVMELHSIDSNWNYGLIVGLPLSYWILTQKPRRKKYADTYANLYVSKNSCLYEENGKQVINFFFMILLSIATIQSSKKKFYKNHTNSLNQWNWLWLKGVVWQ